MSAGACHVRNSLAKRPVQEMDGFSFVLDESNMAAQRAAGIIRISRHARWWQSN
jgi:hypothetical protein